MSDRSKLLICLLLALGLGGAACSAGGGVPPDTAAATTTATGPTTAATATTTEVGTTTLTATSTTPEPGLLVWVDEARQPAVAAAAARFEQATGLPVRVEVLGFGDIRVRIIDQGPLGTGADLFLGTHEWLGELVGAGLVEPIDLGVRAEAFSPVALEAFSLGANLYGLPYSIEAIALYRNTALVPEAPATFEELLAVCDDLEDRVEQCLAIPAGDPYYNFPFVASAGGYIFGYNPERGYDPADVGLDGAGAIAGFTFLDSLVADGYLSASVDYGTMTGLFYQGRAAFMWTAQWAVPDADDAVAAGTLSGYAVSPLPRILDYDAVPLVRAQGFMVGAHSEKQDEARRFLLDYLATEEVMTALYQADQRPPAFGPALDALVGDPHVRAFADSASSGTAIPSITEVGFVWALLGEAVAAIYDQTANPDTALETAADQVRSLVAGG